MGTVFQYAVKFVCGRSRGKVVAPGEYWTAINVHNPTSEGIKLRKKVAVALPGEKPGPVSRFEDAKLGPDEAMEIDREDIFKHAEFREEFLKGYVVIESKVRLDVVAVYTAAGTDNLVETLHTKRVRARDLKVGLPDLVPVPDEHGFFCRRKDAEGVPALVVTVKNQGTATANPCSTEVDFHRHGKVVQPTGQLNQGDSTDLLFPIPFGCHDPDCEFKITVDVYGEVEESDEGNNVATGVCLG
jgi:hypothetical protein